MKIIANIVKGMTACGCALWVAIPLFGALLILAGVCV